MQQKLEPTDVFKRDASEQKRSHVFPENRQPFTSSFQGLENNSTTKNRLETSLGRIEVRIPRKI